MSERKSQLVHRLNELAKWQHVNHMPKDEQTVLMAINRITRLMRARESICRWKPTKEGWTTRCGQDLGSRREEGIPKTLTGIYFCFNCGGKIEEE